MPHLAPLRDAIAKAGSQQALASAIGVRQSTLNYWLTRSRRGVPAEFCKRIETVTGIPAARLRPDVYGRTT